MPNYTTNYNLTKPLETEKYDIKVQNGNMDKLDTAVDDLQAEFDGLEQELTTHKNDYVTYLESELGEEHIIRSLPNGTKDEVVDGKLIKRISPYTIQNVDIVSMITSQPDYDYAYLQLPTDCSDYNIGDKVNIPNYPYLYNLHSANRVVGVGFAKGTTLSQAKTLLTNQSLTYQLAEPLETPLPDPMTPNTREISRLSEQVDKLTNIINTLIGG